MRTARSLLLQLLVCRSAHLERELPEHGPGVDDPAAAVAHLDVGHGCDGLQQARLPVMMGGARPQHSQTPQPTREMTD